MKYLMMLFREEQAIDVSQASVEEFRLFLKDAGEAGSRLGSNALQPAESATVVSVRQGRQIVTDGPFPDTKEQLAGYLLYDCASLDAAIRIAEMLPYTSYGHVEIRPIVEIGG